MSTMGNTFNKIVSKDLIYSLENNFLVDDDDDKAAVNEFRMARVEGDASGENELIQ